MPTILHSFLTVLAGQHVAAVDPILDRMQLLDDDADNYFEQYDEELEERGLESPTDYTADELRQIVLIDQLVRANLAAEVDWKADAGDIHWALAELSAQQGHVLAEFPLAQDQQDTEQVLASVSQSLAAQGFTLLELDLNSDSYPLTLIPTASFESVRDMAAELGLVLRDSF